MIHHPSTHPLPEKLNQKQIQTHNNKKKNIIQRKMNEKKQQKLKFKKKISK